MAALAALEPLPDLSLHGLEGWDADGGWAGEAPLFSPVQPERALSAPNEPLQRRSPSPPQQAGWVPAGSAALPPAVAPRNVLLASPPRAPTPPPQRLSPSASPAPQIQNLPNLKPLRTVRLSPARSLPTVAAAVAAAQAAAAGNEESEMLGRMIAGLQAEIHALEATENERLVRLKAAEAEKQRAWERKKRQWEEADRAAAAPTSAPTSGASQTALLAPAPPPAPTSGPAGSGSSAPSMPQQPWELWRGEAELTAWEVRQASDTRRPAAAAAAAPEPAQQQARQDDMQRAWLHYLSQQQQGTPERAPAAAGQPAVFASEPCRRSLDGRLSAASAASPQPTAASQLQGTPQMAERPRRRSGEGARRRLSDSDIRRRSTEPSSAAASRQRHSAEPAAWIRPAAAPAAAAPTALPVPQPAASAPFAATVPAFWEQPGWAANGVSSVRVSAPARLAPAALPAALPACSAPQSGASGGSNGCSGAANNAGSEGALCQQALELGFEAMSIGGIGPSLSVLSFDTQDIINATDAIFGEVSSPCDQPDSSGQEVEGPAPAGAAGRYGAAPTSAPALGPASSLPRGRASFDGARPAVFEAGLPAGVPSATSNGRCAKKQQLDRRPDTPIPSPVLAPAQAGRWSGGCAEWGWSGAAQAATPAPAPSLSPALSPALTPALTPALAPAPAADAVSWAMHLPAYTGGEAVRCSAPASLPPRPAPCRKSIQEEQQEWCQAAERLLRVSRERQSFEQLL